MSKVHEILIKSTPLMSNLIHKALQSHAKTLQKHTYRYKTPRPIDTYRYKNIYKFRTRPPRKNAVTL